MSDDKALSAGDWFFGKVLHMGANWATTLSGIGSEIGSVLLVLSILPYTLGDLATIIPPAWKAKMVVVALIAKTLLGVWNSLAQKSKNVTGGDLQQTLDGQIAKPGTQTLVDLTKQTPPA